MKAPLLRKLLLVARDDGTGCYNLLIEHNGKTLTKQIPEELCAEYIFQIVQVTVAYFNKHGLGSVTSFEIPQTARSKSVKERFAPQSTNH